MENPATWGEAEKVVYAALTQWRIDTAQEIVGLSDVRTITDALRKAGLLAPDKDSE